MLKLGLFVFYCIGVVVTFRWSWNGWHAGQMPAVAYARPKSFWFLAGMASLLWPPMMILFLAFGD